MERIMTNARWFSHRGILALLSLMMALPLSAQTAKQVLDKAAANVSAKSGAKASFSIKGDQFNTSGTIAIKGRKFQATTPQATIWFDGKTQWTYMKKNEEVNVANPTDAELATIKGLQIYDGEEKRQFHRTLDSFRQAWHPGDVYHRQPKNLHSITDTHAPAERLDNH